MPATLDHLWDATNSQEEADNLEEVNELLWIFRGRPDRIPKNAHASIDIAWHRVPESTMPTSNWNRLVIGLAAGITLGIVWTTSGELDTAYAKATVTAASVVTLFLLPSTTGYGGTLPSAGWSDRPSSTARGS